MKEKLAIALSATALVVALLGTSGPAIAHGVQHALFAHNADKVDGIHASRTPAQGKLLALNSSKKFPASVIPSLSSVDLLEGAECEAYDQTGSIVIESEPLKTFMRLKCDGILAPDAHEPNDQFATYLNELGGTAAANIVPLGDVDRFFYDTAGLCYADPAVCDVGYVITLESNNPNVMFDAKNAGTTFDPSSFGDFTVTGVVEWHTGPVGISDFLVLEVHSPDLAEYKLTVSGEIP